jgi:hypothetical protein
LPNAATYALQLAGADGFLVFPLIGAFGLASLVWLARQSAGAAVVGRFGLASTILTLLVYVPYFYAAPRFLLFPASLLSLGAAIGAVRIGSELLRDRTRSSQAEPPGLLR